MNIPEGFALVPIEPTEAMLHAYQRALKTMIDATPGDVRDQFFAPSTRNGSSVPSRVKARIRWRAMLAAAGALSPPPQNADRLAKAIIELNRAWLAQAEHDTGPGHA